MCHVIGQRNVWTDQSDTRKDGTGRQHKFYGSKFSVCTLISKTWPSSLKMALIFYNDGLAANLSNYYAVLNLIFNLAFGSAKTKVSAKSELDLQVCCNELQRQNFRIVCA